MLDLPDARSLSPESLELLRKIAVRGVEDLGLSVKQIAEIVGVGEPAVRHWLAAFREQGIEGLHVRTPGRPEGSGRSLQPDQEEVIRRILCDDVPEDHQISSSAWTRKAVAELILKLCDVELTLQAVGKYLDRWNMTPQKPVRHAREQDPEEVEEFVEDILPDVLQRAEEEDGELHFADETGARAADQIGASYAPRGETPTIEFPKTRIAQNMISSITPDGELFYLLYSGTFDSEKYIHFLELLLELADDKIFLFVDRHAAHTSHAVEDWLAEHTGQLEVVLLPRYAPEYNPDEFVNNDLKQNLQNEPLPEDTPSFRETIRGIMDHIASLPDRVRGFFEQSKIDLAG